MTAYYNEFKPEAAHMLRQLIKDGHIAAGDVDERSITEVKADDIKNYTQCHFFAGIGGWSVALRLAGWGDDRPVWTGSCPCQPFSSAGRQKGKADERHLWPAWFSLIRELRPATVFGEQVESAIAHGWLDDVYNDMEGQGYAVGAAVLPACAVGKPHQRKRLWFVAKSEGERDSGAVWAGRGTIERPSTDDCNKLGGTGNCGTLGNAEHDGQSFRQVAGSEGQAIQYSTQGTDCTSEFAGASQSKDVADTIGAGLQGHGGYVGQHGTPGRKEPDGYTGEADLQWLQCPDGKSRPVVRDFRSVVDGLHNGTLKFDENSINQSQKEVRLYAKATKQRPRDILQALRDTITSQTVWQKPRGFFGICEAEILLPYLLQLEGCENESGTPSEVEETAWESLRGMWLHSLSSCPPQGWGLYEQSSRQHSDALHLLSWLLARSARQAFEAMLRDASPIGLLVHGVQHRAPILHAFGNAIVPSLAAQFILATKGEVW